ncbi:hypothetical protein MTR80_06525 [Alcaligenes aquatilis]|uniref:Uncharacterized protein n=1 Tax=Alcaligenes aquatilis TaxID=323284 RepID=A0ABY4NM11_9BURK|nr:hypothetical protein [Alcaligenes aquatilis]UQN37357.1 hypothetical protein MTR80_06525 [Alcaligenes aquatilis]
MMFDNDAAHLPISTGSALLIYGWTMQDFVLTLWAAYVVILIVTKLPEFIRAAARIVSGVRQAWRQLKEWKHGSED